MAHYLIVYRPPRPTFVEDATAEEIAVIEKHFAYLQRLELDGRLLMAGRVADGRIGIAVITAKDLPAAQALMNGDPAVRENIFSGEVHPFRVALWSTTEQDGT